MAWTVREYAPREYNDAAEVLLTRVGDVSTAEDMVNNFRSSHSYPLNTFQIGLRRLAPKDALVAQRLKRLPSILAKLKLLRTTMRLTQMQDIGGCRAVLSSVASVRAVRQQYKTCQMKHHFQNEKDYIATPRESGYRGIHLVYRYHSDKIATWNDLKIEIQLRSQIQHAWATAVETIGAFIGQALKSSQGNKEWLDWLRLVSSGFARLEDAAQVPGTPVNAKELRRAIRRGIKRLKVRQTLTAYRLALKIGERPQHRRAGLFLLMLNYDERTLRVRSFKRQEMEKAEQQYLVAERNLADTGAAVLVSVKSIEQLKRAYPNFYQDTDSFIGYLNRAAS